MRKPNIPAVHPGMVLQDELEEIGVTQSDLAAHIGVLPKTINEICRGKRGISAEWHGNFRNRSAQVRIFWLNLQNNWELSQIKPKPLKKAPASACVKEDGSRIAISQV